MPYVVPYVSNKLLRYRLIIKPYVADVVPLVSDIVMG